MKRSLAKSLILVAALALANQPASAFSLGGALGALRNVLPSSYVPERENTLPPIGHVILCARDPGQCRLEGDDTVFLGIAELALLGSVNSSVNESIRPRHDRGPDRWSVAPANGDCEDYALTKRAELISHGWPSRALRIAVAATATGEGHAVLVVRTNIGDIVLDNRKTTPVFWYQADLIWLKIQSQTELGKWRTVGSVRQTS